MKLTISRAALSGLMSKGGSSAPSNPVVPIMGHARLVANNGVLRVSTTDHEVQAEAFAEASIEASGKTTVDAEKLSQIVNRLPGDATISLSREGNDLVVKSGRSRVKLATLSVQEWPALDVGAIDAADAGRFEMTGAEISRLLSRPYASALVNKRTGLECVFLHVRDWNGVRSLCAVGTNGHVLFVASAPLPEGAEAMPKLGGYPGVLLSLETTETILRLFKGSERVRLTTTSRAVMLEDDTTRLTSKLVEGQYVDYERIIPALSADRISLDRARGLAAVNLLETFSGREQGHKLECGASGNSGLLIAAGVVGGEGLDQIEAEITGEVGVFGISSLYLKHMLNAFGSPKITMSFSGPGAPIRVLTDDESTTAVVMPMRVAGDIVRSAVA